MLLGFAVSFYLEIPDRNPDSQGHKITFVVLRGERFGFIVGAVSLVLATFCFLIFSLFHVFPASANFLPITVLSLIPLIIGVWGLREYIVDKTKMMTIVFRATVCIFLVWILMDLYFIYVILT
jgi:1,4-dihydroxy-2-naphthoate octaprenyltransferase